MTRDDMISFRSYDPMKTSGVLIFSFPQEEFQQFHIMTLMKHDELHKCTVRGIKMIES